ncbi:MAG: hypothetical protein HY699_16375 [Deltaproteobacteria bacterium]|nr:hypothetical protein [Deltaproteobacteria bacterium]
MSGAALVVTLLLVAATAALADETAPPTAAAPVEIHAQAEPNSVTIGTRFRYTVAVSAPAEVEIVLAQPTERIGDFDIIDFGDAPPVQRDGRTVLTRWYTLSGYEIGERLVKSPPVYYRQPGEELKEAAGQEIVVTVESLLAQAGNPNDIREIKEVADFPIDWRPYYFVGGALALLLVLAAVLYRVLNRSRRAAATAPPKPPHEVAFEALNRLRRRGLIEEGNFKEYYSALSAVVRAYVEQRFGMRAPEMTTEEFLLGSARNGRLQATHRGLLGEFLTESDMVKFARHVPTIADSERAFSAAKRFIDETAANLLGAPPEGKHAAR